MFVDANIKCYLDDFNLVTIYSEKEITNFHIEFNDVMASGKIAKISENLYNVFLDFDVDVRLELFAHINNRYVMIIEKRKVVLTPKFDDMFYFEGKLGAYVENGNTIFNLWAPVASNIILMLDGIPFLMEYNNGVYSKIFDANYHLKEYYFIVCVNGETKRVIDPYAISSTLNAKSSVVIDLSVV